MVYDVNLTISIYSESTPFGTGNITVEIIKEEINCSIYNVVISSASEQSATQLNSLMKNSFILLPT